jgi:hypothetical protein
VQRWFVRSSRIIRQSSQPEASAPASCSGQCVHHLHGSAPTQPSVSLRQLREPGDGIAGIAADSLRINGAIRQFKQVPTISLFCNSVLRHVRRFCWIICMSKVKVLQPVILVVILAQTFYIGTCYMFSHVVFVHIWCVKSKKLRILKYGIGPLTSLPNPTWRPAE